jgi:hypothetical protein
LANAPTGTPQFPNALNNYPAGHGKRDKTVVNQPPFNLPGVDYRVGIQTGVTLVAPSTSNMPAGCTYDATTGIITVNSAGTVVLDGFDLGNGGIAVAGKNATLNLTIRNCRISLTTDMIPIAFGGSSCNTTVVEYCELYGNGHTNGSGAIQWNTSADGPGFYTIQYCYIDGFATDTIHGCSDAQDIIVQYTMFYNIGSFGHSGLHLDITQVWNTGIQRFWNNTIYCPANAQNPVGSGPQGMGNWNDPAYSSTASGTTSATCQNFHITTSGNAFSITTTGTGYDATHKHDFKNNYCDNGRGGFAKLYSVPVNANIVDNFNPVTGTRFVANQVT